MVRMLINAVAFLWPVSSSGVLRFSRWFCASIRSFMAKCG